MIGVERLLAEADKCQRVIHHKCLGKLHSPRGADVVASEMELRVGANTTATKICVVCKRAITPHQAVGS